MARTDLTEREIAKLQLQAHAVADGSAEWHLTRQEAGQLMRLTGEVLDLRSREANVRQMHDLDGEY